MLLCNKKLSGGVGVWGLRRHGGVTGVGGVEGGDGWEILKLHEFVVVVVVVHIFYA